ncbi:hypothetical protein ABEF95_007901 [Exophiala dermatitidis]
MADQQLQELFLSWTMVVLGLQAITVAGYDKWDDLPFCAKYCFNIGIDNTITPCGFDLSCACFSKDSNLANLVTACLEQSPPCDSNATKAAVWDYGNRVFCNESDPGSASFEIVEGTYALTLALYTMYNTQSGQHGPSSIQMTSTVTTPVTDSATSASTTAAGSSSDDNGDGSATVNATGSESAAGSSSAILTSALESGASVSSAVEPTDVNPLITSYSTQVVTADSTTGATQVVSASGPATTVTVIAPQSSSVAPSVSGEGILFARLMNALVLGVLVAGTLALALWY